MPFKFEVGQTVYIKPWLNIEAKTREYGVHRTLKGKITSRKWDYFGNIYEVEDEDGVTFTHIEYFISDTFVPEQPWHIMLDKTVQHFEDENIKGIVSGIFGEECLVELKYPNKVHIHYSLLEIID